MGWYKSPVRVSDSCQRFCSCAKVLPEGRAATPAEQVRSRLLLEEGKPKWLPASQSLSGAERRKPGPANRAESPGELAHHRDTIY